MTTEKLARYYLIASEYYLFPSKQVRELIEEIRRLQSAEEKAFRYGFDAGLTFGSDIDARPLYMEDEAANAAWTAYKAKGGA